MIEKPTHEQLIENEGTKSVHREADDSWRHGAYVFQVFHRESDDTYWAANYRQSSDGETDELYERVCDIDQVWPVTKTVTGYVSKQPT